MRTLGLAATIVFVVLCGSHRTVNAQGDLRDLDVVGWPCFQSPSGTAKTQDGIERDRGKNRAPLDLAAVKVEALDPAGLLKKVRDFGAHLITQRRSDLSASAKALLDQYEGQIVSLAGWIVLAYPGPLETTTCGDQNYHDWHLEVFEQSSDHHPQIGDPTPIICEVTPRTERQIFRDNVRLHARTRELLSRRQGIPADRTSPEADSVNRLVVLG